MAVTTKKLFAATSNATTTVFSPVSIQLNNQDDLDVYVTLSGGTRVLQLRQSTGSTAQSSHPQVNNTDGLYFPAVSAGTTLYNYQLSTDNNTITFNSALPQGAVVFCERRTRDSDSSYTSFASGSTIRATDLNNSSTESNFTGQDGRNKALTIEGVLFRGDQPSTNFVTTDHIVNGTIVTADIANDSVTADKIPDDTINSEHYVDLSIDTQHIANENVTTAKLAADAVTSSKLADNAVVTDNIVNGNVTHVKLANDAVDGDNIADDSINSEHYVDGSIDTAHIADSQITTAKIAADAVNGTKIADDSINSEHYVDGSIDTVHIADNQITTAKIADGAITDAKIAGGSLDNRYYTETELDAGQLDNRYYTETESDARYFNISTGDTIKDGDSFPDNDTTIATTAAINDRIIDLIDDVGGFVPIANETSFPTANPDVNNGTGTIVSISTVSTNLAPSGTTVTIANGAGSGNTVTITGVPVTIPSGFGFLVETTSTLHTYTFHRLNPKATEVTTVAGISSNITTVANNTANINAVAADASDIGVVAADGTDIGLVAGSIANVNTTAGSIANVNTTATNIANVNNVGNNISNVNAVHSNASNINSAVSNASNINSAVSNASNINSVAGSISNVNTTAGSIANVNTAASNISNVNNFANTYQIASSDPTTDGGGNALAEGDLYFNTTANELKVYNGGSWQGGVTASGNFAAKTGNTFTGTNIHNDNVKSVYGTSSDGLEVFHNGSDSVINDQGTGSLKLQTGGNTKVEITGTGTSVTGNIVVSGNVDGRDVAADGTKLDGITANAIADLSEDGSPQLGANLDTNGSYIFTSQSNGNIPLQPNGTGAVEVKGAGGNDGTLQLNCSANSHAVKIKSPAHSANASYTLTLPTTDGNNHELLKSDGSGNLSWTTVGTSNIANDAVTNAKIADDSIDSEHYVDGSIDTAHIADLQVTTAKIADGAVNSAKIADGAIVNADVNASAAIAGTKISPDFGSQNVVTTGTLGSGDITVTNASPKVNLVDSGNNPDWQIQNDDGTFRITDTTNSSTKLRIDTSGNVLIPGNLDANGGIDVSGSITVTGTVDGVDIAALNTTVGNITTDVVSDTSPQLGGNLDANSKAVLLGDSTGTLDSTSEDVNRICVGASRDFQIQHTGSHTFLNQVGTGDLYIRSVSNNNDIITQAAAGGNIYLRVNAGENAVIATSNAGVELYYDNSKKFETVGNGIKTEANLFLIDSSSSNAGRIKLGTGEDLQIYHSNDNNSYIEESGSGNLVVKADDFYVQNAGANHTQLVSDSDADVKLSFNGTEKFQTTTDGAKVMGTGNFVIPSGTSAQRGSAATGAIRYNTTTSQLEVYNGSAWAGVGASSPQVYSVSNTTTNGAAGTSMVIRGEGFVSGATVKYMGSDGTSVTAGSVAYNSETQLTAVSPALLVSGAPYSIKVTNPDGGEAVIGADVEISAGNAPAWSTASGQLGSNQVKDVAVSGLTVAATDADSQAITYSEVTSVLTSNANTPAATMNLSLNSSTGAITGTAPSVTSDTTYTFTLRATDTAGNTTDRSFNIVVLAAPAAIYWFAGTGYGATGTRSGTTWSHTGYNPNASGGGNANNDRLRVYGNGTGGTYAGFHHFLYSNAIAIPTGHDKAQIYISSLYTNNNGYRYNQGNGWTTSQPSGNSHGSGAFGARNLGSHGTGLQTYDIPATHQGQNRYFQMFVFGGQNGVQYQEITLVKTYNVNNP